MDKKKKTHYPLLKCFLLSETDYKANIQVRTEMDLPMHIMYEEFKKSIIHYQGKISYFAV